MTGSGVISFMNSFNGTVSRAHSAADTLVLINCEGEKVLTNACRSLLVLNVSLILVAEEFQRSEYGVGSGLT